jgi:two-component system cell cycle response regulator DivK
MKTVLVADDNASSRELLREILNGDFVLLEAGDGPEALVQAAAGNPDLLLLDIQMPGLDGFAVLRRLRAQPRFAALPAVALTAFAMEGDEEKARAAGFDAYITKPINAAALRRELAQVLAASREKRHDGA